MAQMKRFMIVHVTPKTEWKKVEENWAKLAVVETATWVRTCFNKEKGVRYCIWLAPDEKTLSSIFKELDIAYESIIEVEETVPDLWGKRWQEHLKAEAKSSTLGF
jgi:hypothetical protein